MHLTSTESLPPSTRYPQFSRDLEDLIESYHSRHLTDAGTLEEVRKHGAELRNTLDDLLATPETAHYAAVSLIGEVKINGKGELPKSHGKEFFEAVRPRITATAAGGAAARKIAETDPELFELILRSLAALKLKGKKPQVAEDGEEADDETSEE